MPYQLEIRSRFARESHVNAMLFAPIDVEVRCLETRLYEYEAGGDRFAAESFLTRLLVDAIGETPVFGGAPACAEFDSAIDIAMKPGLLDLERECLRRFIGQTAEPSVQVDVTAIYRRVYLFGAAARGHLQTILKDLINPAVNRWRIVHG